MKKEVLVTVNLKGGELRMNGQVSKMRFYPPVVSQWLPLGQCATTTFKVGRRTFGVTVERLFKRKGGKRG